MRKTPLILAALLGGASLCSATVTVQGWWHLDSTQPIGDASGNGRNFGSAYSTAHTGGGSVGAELINNGVGGPLDGTGYVSTNCVLWGYGTPTTKAQAAMWAIGYNPPKGAYGIEIWALPQDTATVGGSGGWIFSSGQGGGVALRINNSLGNPSYIDAYVLGTGATIGNPVLVDTNHWMHLAIVDNAGVLTFYTNGIPCGGSLTSGGTTPAGDVYIGTPSDNQAFYGYLDEARMFTFAPGAFSTNDFLLRPPGPMILDNPQSEVVWNGGAATFSVTASFDPTLLYQWQRGGATLPGQTSSSAYLNTVTLLDTGSTFDCLLTSGSLSRTSTVANLTVVSPNAANVAAYRNTISAEPSLLAYFPVDGDTGTTVSNIKDGTHNGALEGGATFDGRTNTTFGARSLSFNANGDVQIPNNPAFEFASGNGTIEALVNLSQPTLDAQTIFTEIFDGGYAGGYYTFGATADGNNLIYTNDSPVGFTWSIPGGLIGKLSHVALVFDNGTNVTAYWNGQNLGTKVQASFGTSPGAPAWIGGPGTSATDNQLAGTVDEVAVYGAALSQSAIQLHYSKFLYGTNTSAPMIVSQPASRTLLAGANPVLSVTAQGTLPLTYQWTSNNVPIAGANSQILALANISATASYGLTVQNSYGSTNTQPIVITVAAPPSGYASTAMADHPTAFWRLSESSGSTAVDSAGFNDAAYSGGFTLGAPAFHGESGTGASFDGSSGRAIAPLTQVLNPAGPFTIEFWAATPRTWSGTAGAGFMVPIGSMDRPGRSGGYEFYLDGNYNGYEFHTAAGGGYDQIVGDDGIPAPNTWSHVVGVYDGTNIYEYVDGILGSSGNNSGGTAAVAADQVTPNTVKGFYIGSREDNVRFWQGTIADVAFYNYALSAAQIYNHYSVSFQHAVVVTQPVGVTNIETSTVSLSAVISGLPNTYQWYVGTTPLSDAVNFDGTAHFQNGVTNATLTIVEAQPTDSGLYHLVASNPTGGATTASARVLILAQTNAPTVTSVTALGTPNSSGSNPFLVKVTFSGRIDPGTGATPANYVLSPAVTISGVYVPSSAQAAAFGGDWRTAYLQTAGLTPGVKYSLTVSGVKDQAQTPNTIATSTTSFRVPVLTSGELWWDFYYPVTPQGVANLQQILSSPPYGPQANASLTIFDTDQLTGGDLNNNPAFGAAGDNYGDSLSGWITPTVSGSYYFFLASDDASALFLSSNSDPANAAQIAAETGCCHGFLEPGNATEASVTSDAQTLTAGVPYFIQALHTEGNGGDYVKVAWRLSSDSTASTNLLAIGANNPNDPAAAGYAPVLSSYAAVPAPTFGHISVGNGQLTLPWNSYQNSGTILESTNLALPLSQWTPVPGNPNPLVVPLNSAPKMFYRLSQ